MQLDLDDDIAAVATPAGPALRSVIRLSGSSVLGHLSQRMTGQDADVHWNRLLRAQRVSGQFQVEGWRNTIPVDAWIWPTHRSYTGQPSVEIHLLGSPPLVDAVLEQLYRDGVRPARAGEFTLRAFLAGRIDLVQAEAVLGVIDATDHEQLHQALSQLAGGLSRRISELRELLLLDLADLEAGLDFVEDGIEFVQRTQMLLRIGIALELSQGLLRQSEMRMLSGSRPRVVLAGLPNAGKSTLFNRLVGDDLAIVSDIAGTTRDYLKAELSWHGQHFELVDTAGIENHSQGISAQADQQRQSQISQSDVALWCSALSLNLGEAEQDKSMFEAVREQGVETIHIWTMCDRQDEVTPGKSASLRVSALTGTGLNDLRNEVLLAIQRLSSHRGEWLGTTAARARDSLERCAGGLQRTQLAIEHMQGDELISIELRTALDALGEVCGAVHTDDILDRIFSRFCIGK